MKKVAKIAVSVVWCGFFYMGSCGSHQENAPFDGILEQAPYAGITDSIGREPKNAALYYRRGMLLLRNELAVPALADLRRAWELAPDEEHGVALSNALLARDPAEAESFLRGALQQLPRDLFLELNLVEALRQQHRTAPALAVCDSIISRYPGQIDAWMSRAALLDEQGDSTAATAALERAYQLAPFDSDLCHDLAFRYAQDKNARALALCDSLIRADSAGKHAEPYYFKGVYFYNTGQKEKALDLFNQSILHDYYFLDAYLEKGRILYEQKRFNAALKEFRLATTISPTFADAYFWLGKCQEATGELTDARDNYLRAYGFDKTLTQAKEAADRLQQAK